MLGNNKKLQLAKVFTFAKILPIRQFLGYQNQQIGLYALDETLLRPCFNYALPELDIRELAEFNARQPRPVARLLADKDFISPFTIEKATIGGDVLILTLSDGKMIIERSFRTQLRFSTLPLRTNLSEAIWDLVNRAFTKLTVSEQYLQDIDELSERLLSV